MGKLPLVVILILSGFGWASAPRVALSQESDAEATISALQTQVAELEAMLTPASVATRAAIPHADEAIELGDGTVLDYYYLVDDGYGGVQVLGEISNPGELDVIAPVVRFTLYDTVGNLIEAPTTSSPLPSLLAGGRIPFSAYVADVSANEIARADVAACVAFGDASEFGSVGLMLESVVEETKTTDRLVVNGLVRNTTDGELDRVAIFALVYLDDGRYAGTGRTIIQAPIPPGRTARFDLSAGDFDFPGVDATNADDFTYELWAGTVPASTGASC